MEFQKLLETDQSELGAIYGCHKDNGQACIGWLLDQRQRDLPSIRLRLALITTPSAVRCLEEAHDGGHELFGSLEAMCRANGVE
ncbi:MAG: hypothetical protein JNK72_24545 [Myxococcales bacterium]|nr:hypothetical protein [Myxococcales bacterium]